MRRAIALLSVLALVAGCGGGKDSVEAAPKPKPRPGHGALELERLLPAKVGATVLAKRSASGVEAFDQDPFGRRMEKFLDSRGGEQDDMSFAIARGAGLTTGVLQVPAIDAPTLRQAVLQGARPQARPRKLAPTMLSGKPVTKASYRGSALYLYSRPGRLFFVDTRDDNLARRVLALLP